MSRSKKKNPIIGYTTSKSEKQDKQLANRKLRSAFKVLVNNSVDPDEIPVALSSIRSVSNVWTFSKDGKHFFDTVKSYRK